MNDWEIVIGLEIHAELNTQSKLFSSAPNRFGDEPNTNITEVCTGMPGSLPVLNKEAVRKAVQFGTAIGAEVAKFSKFDRKSYFYPDSPRNFQITQFDQPIIRGGLITAEVEGHEMTFQINRVHLEDDAGMLKHFPDFAGVDYNRAGVPLIEIVSEPCIHSPKQAVAYAMAVKAILQYLDASDCNMEEGSLRFDANISVRKKGEKKLRNKTEIKNMNSFSFMEKALTLESARQIKLYEKNPTTPHEELVRQETYRWDPEKSDIVLMRRKESSDDYRYFPEPDLLPIVLTDSYIDEIRAALPELPMQREKRYVHDYALNPDLAFLIVSDKPTADYFEEAIKAHNNPRALANWITIEFPGRLKDKGLSLPTSPISAKHIAKLVALIDNNTITGRMAKEIADMMVEEPTKDPELMVSENSKFQPLTNSSEIEKIVDEVLAGNPDSITSYKAGRDKAFSFLVGQVMKLSHGKASPQIVNTLLKEKIG